MTQLNLKVRNKNLNKQQKFIHANFKLKIIINTKKLAQVANFFGACFKMFINQVYLNFRKFEFVLIRKNLKNSLLIILMAIIKMWVNLK